MLLHKSFRLTQPTYDTDNHKKYHFCMRRQSLFLSFMFLCVAYRTRIVRDTFQFSSKHMGVCGSNYWMKSIEIKSIMLLNVYDCASNHQVCHRLVAAIRNWNSFIKPNRMVYRTMLYLLPLLWLCESKMNRKKNLLTKSW